MHDLMKCVVEAVVHQGIGGLFEFVPGGNYLYAIGADAYKRYQDKKAAKKLEDEVKEAIVAKADAAIRAAQQAVEASDAARRLPPREKELLTQWVAGIPDAARASLMRKDDPTGTTLPDGYAIRSPEDVVKLLPQTPPRFAAGEWVPGRVDNWRLVRKLGGGGFGEVWLANHAWKTRDGKPEQRAVKFCTDPIARTRLVTHEKDLIVRVMQHAGEHPNIVPLLECHLSGDAPWLMYEYVPGGTLADLMLEWAKLPPAERVNRAVLMLDTIAAAVGHCHKIHPPIVHRDLKPANVLLADGIPRVTDFGIGGTAVQFLMREERHGFPSTKGGVLPSLLSGSYSLIYASPQQRGGEPSDPRDDVHALGILAYQLLTGRLDAEVKGNWQKRLQMNGIVQTLIDLIGDSVSDEISDRPANANAWREALPGSMRSVAATSHSLPAPAPFTAPISVPAPHAWQITARGEWYRRQAGNPGRRWKKATNNPSEVLIRSGEEYRLSFEKDIVDADLAGLTHLSGLTALTHLELRYCRQVTNAGLAHLRGLTALTALDLKYCEQITDAGLAYLQGLTILTYLDLHGCQEVTDAGLAHLQGLTALTHLDLGGCQEVTDAGLAHLQGLTTLTHLDLHGCQEVTDAGLAHLQGLTTLTHLDLGGCQQVTDAGLAHLQGLTALTHLDLGGCRQVTDAGLAHLQGLTALTHLDLGGCRQVTDAGLAHLQGLKLQDLCLSSCQHVTTATLDLFRDYIISLNLSYCKQVTDTWLAMIGNYPFLRNLHLTGCSQVKDTGLKHFRRLDELFGLFLPECDKLTDAGLAHLRRGKSLRLLYLPESKREHKIARLYSLISRHHHKITNHGVESLRKALPDCEIQQPSWWTI
ncbi:protein kinase domain-containing protein [Fimbriiglobus ruber]|uniref:Fructose-1,6-bisphosphatase, type I n=1 Tax=Fimbriiglobus ruber TaxID=1908690 RepID=A0A225DAU6_9BACT|nr:protein kinase [Fimbriiglobus ruber]OWK38681.1 Fructose-1,6-bisphosphatase, type I [Fimbriiglobus ruber]